jgi:hypothetical protein
MEHETVENKVIGTKRILTGIVGGGAGASLVSATLRVAVFPYGDYSSPLNGLLGLGIILGLFVSLLALNTRLQVERNENEQRAVRRFEQQ